MALGNLVVNLTGRTGGLENSLQKGRGLIRGFVGQANTQLGKLGMAGLGIGALQTAFDKLSFPVKLAMQAETTAAQFEVLLGSASKAQTVLADLQQFAAATPFETPELTAAARSLLAFGEGSDTVVGSLRRIGDVASAVGAPIGEIAELYGKARVQGTLFAEDINQLTGRGIPIIQEFAKQLGVSQSEVKKLGSEGKITFANLEQAFVDLTSEGGKFNGMMETMSGTMEGKLSAVTDDFMLGLKNLGEAGMNALSGMMPLVEKLAGGFRAVTGVVKDLAGELGKLPDIIAKTFVAPELIDGQNFRMTKIGKEWAPEDVGNALRPRIPAAPAPLTPEDIAEIERNRRMRNNPGAGELDLRGVPELARGGLGALGRGFDAAMQKADEFGERLQQTMEEQKRRAAQLKDEMQTPFESLEERLREARALFQQGLLDRGDVGRIADNAKKELAGLSGRQQQLTDASPAAIQKGSREDFSAFVRATRQGAGSQGGPEERTAKATEKTAARIAEMLSEMREQTGQIRKNAPVVAKGID